ncbi:MAG: NADPH-dependent FMN reductase [Marmoricola sp.]
MTRIAIILGSTRPGRVGDQVGRWVLETAAARRDVEVVLIDLREQALPHLDEPYSPMLGRYQHEHTRAWARMIAGFDGFVFVTPEYNQGIPGALKDAIDYLHAEWADKAAGIVSYGVAGGASAAGQLRRICGQLGMADVSRHVVLNLHHDFEAYSLFGPTEQHASALTQLLDQVITWSTALAPLRSEVRPAS